LFLKKQSKASIWGNSGTRNHRRLISGIGKLERYQVYSPEAGDLKDISMLEDGFPGRLAQLQLKV
jgi:hypothetical protein